MEKQLSPTEHNSLENRNKQQTNLVSKTTTNCNKRYNILCVYKTQIFYYKSGIYRSP